MSALKIEVLPLPERETREGMRRVCITIPAADLPKLQAWMNSDSWEKAEVIRKAGQVNGLKSMEVALDWALHHDTSGARVFAYLLASMYNGNRVKFDLSDLKLLDQANFEHAMNCIRLCQETHQEPHQFFKDGGELFEQMIALWGMEKKRRAKA